jgi:hypothetical protein
MPRPVPVLALAALALLGCSTSQFTSTWKDPETRAGALRGKTVAAIFVTKDASQRRSAEVHMANELTNRGARGVTGYTLVPANGNNGEGARASLQASGIDVAVIMRIAAKDQKASYKPGSTNANYAGFASYYGYAYAALSAPVPAVSPTAPPSADTGLSMETVIYRLADDKLLWASMNHVSKDDNVTALIDETADAIAKQVTK